MAKSSGLGMTVTIDDSGSVARIISNDVTNCTLSTPHAMQDTTGVNVSAHERIHLLKDAAVSYNGPFNPAAAPSSHAVFSTLTTARVNVIVVGGKTLTLTALFSDYSFNRGADGSFIYTAPGMLSSGVAAAWT